MAIVERLMKPGTWDITLLPDTPKSLRDVLQPFGHIVIQEARIDPRVMADADILSLALYVGPLRRKPTPYTLQGSGMAIWLGDEESKGQIISPNQNMTFANWIANILGLGLAITAGTVTAVGAGVLNWNAARITQRAAIDYICAYFTGLNGVANPAEYRVNNNGTMDAGLSSALFNTTPKAIVTPREGGRELGIEPLLFGVEIDGDSYSTAVIEVGSAGNATANLAPATTYKDIHGNLVVLQRVVSNTLVLAGQEANQAAAQLALYPLRQVITLSTNRYDVRHDIQVGDWLYVYDPEHDVVDLTNEQHYRGQTIHPNKLRVYALTWPIEGGMAVYYRDGPTAVYTDLTNWVSFEKPGTTFELGFPLRGLTVF